MIFSNSYDGAYPRDLAHGFYDSKIEIGFISLSNAPKPQWLGKYAVKDFSDKFGADISFVKKVTFAISVVRDFKPNLIQAHLFQGGIIGLIVGKTLRIPVIHTRHHLDEHYQSGTFIHRWIDRFVARNSNHVVVCSKATKKWLVEVEGIKENHITVINQGFDFSFLQPTSDEIAKAAAELGFSESKLDIVCVARYSKAKGQNYLLHAMTEIVKTIPDISLTFMGPGDSSWLHKLVNELNLQKYVTILPSRYDVPACLAAADMIIHPSLADSFSQLVIEAQAVGGLLIVSDVAAAREQILDKETGVIIPPRDADAITETVLELILNPEIGIKIRKQGPIHVRNAFTWQRMVQEELECIYNYAQ